MVICSRLMAQIWKKGCVGLLRAPFLRRHKYFNCLLYLAGRSHTQPAAIFRLQIINTVLRYSEAAIIRANSLSILEKPTIIWDFWCHRFIVNEFLGLTSINPCLRLPWLREVIQSVNAHLFQPPDGLDQGWSAGKPPVRSDYVGWQWEAAFDLLDRSFFKWVSTVDSPR